MYLAKRKVKATTFKSGYSNVSKFRLEKDDLEKLVIQLRNGNLEVRELIILSHLGIVLQIVGRYVTYFPFKTEDLMSVATLSLVETVNDFALKGRDNNISGYIVSNVHGKLSRFISEEDRLIQLSTRAWEHLVEKAKEYGVSVESLVPKFVKLVKNEEDEEEVKVIKGSYEYDRLITTDDNSGMSVDETLGRCNFTKKQMIVYQGMIDGLEQKEIGKPLGISQQAVGLIKRQIYDKLLVQLLKEEYI